MVAGTGGQHLDLPTPGREAVGDLAQEQLGAPHHIVAVAGRDEGDASVGHGRARVPAPLGGVEDLVPRYDARQWRVVDICVCGTQVPFTSGGAELLVENLVEALRDAGHRVETVLLPTAWDRDRILDAAAAWRLVPLDFEMAITLNFPSYFARHPRKVAWLLHQHRAAYDALGQEWSDFGLDDVSLEMHRTLVEWDTVALDEAERRYTISGVVADRLARYNGLAATPLHHPPPLADRLHEGPFGDEVVCVTRLEANKRPGAFVEAFAQVTGPVHGALLGKGSQLDALRDRAGELAAAGRGRPVEVAGFVDDDALVDPARQRTRRGVPALRRGLRLRHAPGLRRPASPSSPRRTPAACSSGSSTR